MDLAIRQATLQDAERIHEIHLESVGKLCGESYNPRVIHGWLQGRSPAGYSSGIENGAMFVAEKDGAIVGFAEAIPGETARSSYTQPGSARA